MNETEVSALIGLYFSQGEETDNKNTNINLEIISARRKMKQSNLTESALAGGEGCYFRR